MEFIYSIKRPKELDDTQNILTFKKPIAFKVFNKYTEETEEARPIPVKMMNTQSRKINKGKSIKKIILSYSSSSNGVENEKYMELEEKLKESQQLNNKLLAKMALLISKDFKEE